LDRQVARHPLGGGRIPTVAVAAKRHIRPDQVEVTARFNPVQPVPAEVADGLHEVWKRPRLRGDHIADVEEVVLVGPRLVEERLNVAVDGEREVEVADHVKAVGVQQLRDRHLSDPVILPPYPWKASKDTPGWLSPQLR